jgi:hypothetical protein
MDESHVCVPARRYMGFPLEDLIELRMMILARFAEEPDLPRFMQYVRDLETDMKAYEMDRT